MLGDVARELQHFQRDGVPFLAFVLFGRSRDGGRREAHVAPRLGEVRGVRGRLAPRGRRGPFPPAR